METKKPIEASEAPEAPEAPKPVDTFMEQQTQLLDMISGGIAGLAKLSADRNFDEEKINKIVEEKLNEREYIQAGDLPSELESNGVVFENTFDDQLSEHSVITTDSLQEEIENTDFLKSDIVDDVIDQIEITRK